MPAWLGMVLKTNGCGPAEAGVVLCVMHFEGVGSVRCNPPASGSPPEHESERNSLHVESGLIVLLAVTESVEILSILARGRAFFETPERNFM